MALLFMGTSLCQAHVKGQGNLQAKQEFPSLSQALEAIRVKHGILTGLETSRGDTNQPPLVLDLTVASVPRLLNSIVAQRPDYAWAFLDGVYILYQKGPNITNLKISEYSTRHSGLTEASTAINRIVEFQKFLSEQNLKRRELEAGPPLRDKQKNSIILKNASLGRVLNQIIKKFGKKHWMVVRYGERKEFLAVYFQD